MFSGKSKACCTPNWVQNKPATIQMQNLKGGLYLIEEVWYREKTVPEDAQNPLIITSTPVLDSRNCSEGLCCLWVGKIHEYGSKDPSKQQHQPQVPWKRLKKGPELFFEGNLYPFGCWRREHQRCLNSWDCEVHAPPLPGSRFSPPSVWSNVTGMALYLMSNILGKPVPILKPKQVTRCHEAWNLH